MTNQLKRATFLSQGQPLTADKLYIREVKLSAQVVNLRQFATDRRQLQGIRGIDFVKVDGVSLFVSLLTDRDISPDWLSTVRWQVTHIQSGRRAQAGRNGCQPRVSLLSTEKDGVIIEIRPIFPSLGKIQMDEYFRLDLWTEAGHRFFLSTPFSLENDETDELTEPEHDQPFHQFKRPNHKSRTRAQYLSVVR